MENIFEDSANQDKSEQQLVRAAQQGSYAALEKLITRHRSFIFNISLRMCGSVHDADDATQEILIKVITHLSTFQGKSSFRTWLYRIVSNHVLNMKRGHRENLSSSFESHRIFLENIPDTELGHEFDNDAQKRLLIEETKTQCLMGMLLCLDRKERLVFTLGAIFNARSSIAGEIVGVSAVNFRKILSRSRKKIQNYMCENCGLMNNNNVCRCSKKTQSLVDAGIIDPGRLEFASTHSRKIRDFVSSQSDVADNTLNLVLDGIYKEQPFAESPDYVEHIKTIVKKMNTVWDMHGLQ